MNRGSRAQYSRGGFNGRYNSSRGRGGASRGGSRSTTAKGVFADGIWHCNCTPRLPAEHFKVKKEGKNQGRWFYTCQNQQAQRCDFFLWDEDAKLREEGAVLNNSRTEPSARGVSAAQDGWDAGRGGGGSKGMFAGIDSSTARLSKARVQEDDESTDDESTQVPPSSTKYAHSNVSKRKAEASLDDDDDELLPWPLTGQEEQELVDATDASAPPETPRKAAKTGIYATPATTVEKKRTIPWLQQSDDATFTPTTPTAAPTRQADYLDSPSKPSTRALPPIEEQAYGPTPTLQASTPGTQPKSPSPSTRHRDALANPADSSSSLTSEALAALDAITIPPNVLGNLRSILSKHDLKTQGVVKGRDISRLALKAKEAKIVELQARIASLEADREVDRGVIRGLRWEAENHVSGMATKDE